MDMSLLSNQVKNYDWGSTTALPRLLGKENPEGKPWAELWMGAHPASPSKVSDGTPLDALIESADVEMLGEEVRDRFGALPFLLKLLAVEKPLSLQVHPDRRQAEEGWARENAAGLPIEHPLRNYKDQNHKPEILCALTPFTAMCGFRSPLAIHSLLGCLGILRLSPVLTTLSGTDDSASLQAFMQNLLQLPPAEKEAVLAALPGAFSSLDEHSDSEVRAAASLSEKLLAAYPADICVLAPFFLNIVELQTGQALYIPSGILHSYVEGLGVELMADSDNVIRGGLTPKHVDARELCSILRFETTVPRKIVGITGKQGLERYQTPCCEFALSKANHTASAVSLESGHFRILVVTEGIATLTLGTGESLSLSRGESAFVSASAPDPQIHSSGTVYIASDGIASLE